MNLKRGSASNDVKELQSHLLTLGFYTGRLDGEFGPKTESAVKHFQSAMGLHPDGIAGVLTDQAITRRDQALEPVKKDVSPLAVVDSLEATLPKASFDTSVLYVLRNEGGYVNTSGDKGGPTKYGITEATYAAFKGHRVSAATVKAMPLGDAKAIYERSYWVSSMADLDQGVATAILDWSVLHGPEGARKLAQQVAVALGHSVVVDGDLGAKTVEAINACDPKIFLVHYQAGIRAFLADLVRKKPSQRKFAAGWSNRIAKMASLA